MDKESELNGLINEWEGLYHQLMRISQDQLDLMRNKLQEDQLVDRFAALSAEWENTRAQVSQFESSIKEKIDEMRVKAIFDSSIMPLIREIQSIVRETSARMEQAMAHAGGSLRNLQERRHVSQAYSDPDYHLHMSVYIDQKK